MAGSRFFQKISMPLFLVCWLLEKSTCQDITLELQTHGCSHGLFSNRHSIDFTSVVHLGEEIENFSMAVVFVINKTNNEIHNLVAQLNNCGIDQSPCRCFSRKTSYRIKCSIPAEKSYSEANVYAYISNLSGKNFNSETRRIPTIYDESDLQLSLNGQSLDNCILPINEKTRSLTFCCSNGPSPLTARIHRNGVLVASSATCASYEHPSSLGSSLYQLVVNVCQDHRPVVNRTCSIQATSKSSHTSTMDIETLFVFGVVLLFVKTS